MKDEYKDQEDVYDIVHSYSKNHVKETAKLMKTVRGAIGRDPESWLDVACGTGHHLEALEKAGIQDLAGIDNSPAQIKSARTRLQTSSTKLELADMRDFDVSKKFDVVSCLFSSVGHLLLNEDYYRALKQMALHVKPKGVVLVEPWIAEEDFVPGRVDAETFNHENTQIVRITKHSLINPMLCNLEFRFIVSTKGYSVIRDWTTNLELRLRTMQEQKELFEEVFQSVEFQRTGSGSRGMFVARKPKIN